MPAQKLIILSLPKQVEIETQEEIELGTENKNDTDMENKDDIPDVKPKRVLDFINDVRVVVTHVCRPEAGLVDQNTQPLYVDGINNDFQVSFMCKEESVAEVLERLQRVGVATMKNSGTVTVLPVEHFRQYSDRLRRDSNPGGTRDSLRGQEHHFIALTSVLRVETLTDQIHAAANFDFDFLCFVLVAAVLAGVIQNLH